MWVAVEDALVAWDGTGWATASGNASVNPAGLVGVSTTADASKRLAGKSNGVLFSCVDAPPGSGDMRQVINKAAAGGTASH